MSSSVNVEVTLKLRDGATAGVQAAGQAARKEAEQTATATEKAAQRATEAVAKSANQQRTSYERVSLARQTLGVRSEKAIQDEIKATQRAYSQLAAAGFASANEQVRAYDAVQRKVTSLTNEMGKLTASQKRVADEAQRLAKIEANEAQRLAKIEADQARGQKVLRYGATAVAGTAAAAYTLANPAKEAMSYDRRLAGMANTAYVERDAAGRIVGMQTLERGVNDARKFGGGTREQAAEALDTMIASGTVSDTDAIKMLPGIMKAATASGAGANELATIAIRAKQSFKIKAEDLPSVLSAAMAAGQAGGFELKDMAKWLPQQMAMAGNLGLIGKEGFAKLAAWNQASVITAGTKDEGGNNLRDLLNELNTPHFKRFLADQYLGNGEKAKKGEKEQRLKSMDEVFLEYQNRGVDKVSATVDIMEKVFSKDKTYQSLQEKLRATKGDDKDGQRAILEAMAAQVEGTDVGKVFHNQQSLMAFIGLMNNQKYVDDVLSKVRGEYVAPEDKSSISTAHGVMTSTAAYKMEQAGEDNKLGQKAAMDSLTPAIGKAASAFSDLASQYPLLTGATTLATGAIGALAGAAGLATLAMGGKILGGAAITRYAGSLASGKLATAGRVGGIAGMGAMVGDYALPKVFGEESAIARYGSSALNGAAIGATVGSIIPGLGTGIGAAVGGVGGLAWEGIKDLLKPAEQKPLDVNARFQFGLAPGLVLQSQSMQTTGGHVYMNTGNALTGAPG